MRYKIPEEIRIISEAFILDEILQDHILKATFVGGVGQTFTYTECNE